MKRKPSPPPVPAPRKNMRGNILFTILIGIFLFGLLTLAISDYSKDQSNILPEQTRDDQINRMLAYVGAVEQAIGQMAISGASPSETLYQNLDLSKPGDAGYEAGSGGNHALELYYPTGGGISYQSGSSNSGAPVATGYGIDKDAIITGIGPTDTGVGDIVFTANIQSASYCARINQIVNNSTTVPTMDSTAFTSLFTSDAAVTVDAAACALCVNVKQMCVFNGTNAWGFYAALYPG